MSPNIRRMTCREVERLLSRHGFDLISQHGSHRKWRNQERRTQVIVPEHAGKTLPLGTLRNILINAQIPDAEWQR
jgi:predicted RNA binding protein YcfA (HicA-like mRNA interferase family)